MFTKDFVKEMLCGNKRLLKKADCKFINIIRYDELSVKSLYNKFMTLDGFADYMPTKFAKGRCCDREYMFNVANTLYPEIVKELHEHALK